MSDARVPIPLTGGLDDSTDPLALRPPFLSVSENTRVIKKGAVSKRPAWGGILRAGSPTGLVVDGDERVLVLDADGGGVVDADGVSVDPSNAAPLPLVVDRIQIAPGRGYVHSVQAKASASYVCVAWSQVGRVNALTSAAGDDIPELDSEVWACILDSNLRLRWGPHLLPSQLRWLPRVEPVGDGQFAVFACGLGAGWVADLPFSAGQDTELYGIRYDVDSAPAGAGAFLGDLQVGHYGSGLAWTTYPYQIYDTTTTYDPAAPATPGIGMVVMNRRDAGNRYVRLIGYNGSVGSPFDLLATEVDAHSVAIFWDADSNTILLYDAGDDLVYYDDGTFASPATVAGPALIGVNRSGAAAEPSTYDYLLGPFGQRPRFYVDEDGDLYLNEFPVVLTGSGPAVPSFGSAETERLPQIYEPAVVGDHLLFVHGCGGNQSASFKIGASDLTLYYRDSSGDLAPTARLGETRHGDPGHTGYFWDTNSLTNRSGACVTGQVATIGGELLYPMALQSRLQNPRGSFANPIYDDEAAPALYNQNRNAYSGAGYYNDEQVVSLVRVSLASNPHSVVRYGQSSLVAAGAVSLWTGDRAVVPVAVPRPYFAGVSAGTNLPSSASLGVVPTSTTGTGEVKFDGVWATRLVLVVTTPDGLQLRSPPSNARLTNLPDEDSIPPDARGLEIQPHPSTVALLDAGLAVDVEVYVTNRGEAGGAGEPDHNEFAELDESTYTLVTRAPLQQDSSGGYFALDLYQDLCRYATDTLGWGIPTEVPPRRALALYTTTELEPTPPPAAQVMAQAGDYVFLVSAEEPTEIWYSKPLVAGRVPEFNPLLTMSVPPEAGRCISLAAAYDRVYLLCERGVWELPAIGGPDSNGNGSLPAPRLTYRGNPCTTHMGTVSTPMGVFYVTEEGPRLIGQEGGPAELGTAVSDQLDWNNIVGAVHLDTADEVVWFDSDRAAVLNTLTGAWSTVSLLTASAGRLGSLLARINQAGVLRVEDATSVLDGSAYPLATISTAWIDFGDPLAWKRSNEVVILGRIENDPTPALGKLLVEVAYDYDDTVVDSFDFRLEEIPTHPDGTFRLEIMPTRGKSDAIKVTIRDTTETSGQTTANNYLWTIVSLEIRARGKAGLSKLPATAKGG